MTSAMHTLVYEWGVPHMNVQDLRSSAYLDNKGSLKVFEKNGFEEVCRLKDWALVSESRGGGKRSIVVVKWKGGKGKV